MDTTSAYSGSMGCGAVVQVGMSIALLIVGIKYKDACCDQPIANWNIAAGAIGVIVAVIFFITLVVSKIKANKYEPELPPEMVDRAPDGSELSEAQKEAVRKAITAHERNRVRKSLMYEGPVGKLFAVTQSCQGCYVIIMVIIGSVYVWSTSPNEGCLLVQPRGCDPFLWNWTQGWLIVYFVMTGLICCLACCAICAMVCIAGSKADDSMSNAV
mmetsp:Transcript_13881/g.39298  ORF Transcript_13881/g.39298 Transcript_13881/m.39298 type:complete len:214 (+) Transcript_13881:341-982(+)